MKSRLVAIVLSISLFFAFILLTDPQEINLIAILVPFVLLGVALYNLITIITGLFFRSSAKNNKMRLFVLVSTVILVNFVLLSSIGQLTLQDTVLTALITIVGGFYLYKFQIN